MAYSKPCSLKGCVDWNMNIHEAVDDAKKRGTVDQDFPNERRADAMLFHHMKDGVQGFTQQIGCGCEIRGGGNLISPLHIHYCPTHGKAEAAPTLPEVFGAWKYDHNSGTVTDEDGETIATVETGHEPHGKAIEAAPKMREALDELVAAFDGEIECTEILGLISNPDGKIRKAIAASKPA